jgi:hypothetical protein
MRRLPVLLSVIFAAHAGLFGQAFEMQKLDERWTLERVIYLDSGSHQITDTAKTHPVSETRVFTRSDLISLKIRKYYYLSYPNRAYEGETDLYIRPMPNHEEETITVAFDPHSNTYDTDFRHSLEYEYARERVANMNVDDHGLCGTEIHRRLYEGHQPDVQKEISLAEASALLKRWGVE